jgi:hypothetical protein
MAAKIKITVCLGYAVNVWSPYRLAFIEDFENVQMRATKLNS